MSNWPCVISWFNFCEWFMLEFSVWAVCVCVCWEGGGGGALWDLCVGEVQPRDYKYVLLLFSPPNMVSEPEVSSSNPGECDLLK
jgi:hypothetical protein